jgi:hypothetical protein
MRWWPAVVGLNDLFGYFGKPANCDKLEIERSLLISHEASIERATGALMAGIAGGNREASGKCRLIARSLGSDGFGHRSIQTSTALLQVLTGPILWKCDGKPNPIRFAIRAGSAIKDAVDAAVRGQNWPRLTTSSARRAAC